MIKLGQQKIRFQATSIPNAENKVVVLKFFFIYSKIIIDLICLLWHIVIFYGTNEQKIMPIIKSIFHLKLNE